MTITLETSALRLDLLPEAGASIVSFALRHAGAWGPLMRPTPPEAIQALNPSLMASFNLLPWSNRIAGARFDFQGRAHALRANTPQGFAIHGDAMRRPWRVVDRRADAATCALDSRDFPDFNFPFPLAARITYSLTSDTLDTALVLVNTSDRPMPAGFGFHPFFNRAFGAAANDEAQLRLNVAGVYPPLAGMTVQPIATPPLPGHADPRDLRQVPPAMDFRALTAIGRRDIDHCFGGWDGRADIVYPSAGLALHIACDPVFGHVVVYTPPGKPFFCVEPVTHANDGFNLFAAGCPGSGVRVLQPGEPMQGSFRITIA